MSHFQRYNQSTTEIYILIDANMWHTSLPIFSVCGNYDESACARNIEQPLCSSQSQYNDDICRNVCISAFKTMMAFWRFYCLLSNPGQMYWHNETKDQEKIYSLETKSQIVKDWTMCSVVSSLLILVWISRSVDIEEPGLIGRSPYIMSLSYL